MAGCFVSGGALFFPYAAPRKYQTLGHNLPRGSGVGINYVAPWWGGRDRVALMPHALMIRRYTPPSVTGMPCNLLESRGYFFP